MDQSQQVGGYPNSSGYAITIQYIDVFGQSNAVVFQLGGYFFVCAIFNDTATLCMP